MAEQVRLDRDALLADVELQGLEFCAAYTSLIDGWVGALYASIGAPDDVAVVAVGGYGRGELCPGSDLDLLLLHSGRRDIAQVAEGLWYPIWDAALKLGHSVRTCTEALKLAADDLDTATSLLSARTVAGDDVLTQKLATAARAQWQKRSRRYLADLDRSRRERPRAAGEVAFLREPDLKEGRGGLRDVHALDWAEASQAVVIEADHDALSDARATLLQARVALHRVTGRHSDVLILQEQDAVAEQLGWVDADALMAKVAHAGRSISWVSDEAWWSISAQLRRSYGRRATSRDKDLGHGLVLRDGFVQLSERADLHDPFLALRAALLAARAATRIHRRALEALAAADAVVPEPWTREARALLADVLAAGHPAIDVLESLDHVGLLVRFLPEWEPVRSRPQRNAYHRFTVDRHLLEAAANAAGLTSRTTRPDLLTVGALLHDIGKGYPGDHTEVGMGIVAAIAQRMGYPPEDTSMLVQMVQHHLLLPDVATRRDLSDPGTIAHVASQVGSLEVLQLLDALTEADSMATGPSAWGTWKADLVHQLVTATAHVLGGGDAAEVGDPFPNAEQRQLLARGERAVLGADDVLTVVSPDRPGLFAKVAGVLALRGIDVLEASAFSDDEGMALEVMRVRAQLGADIDWPRIMDDVHAALDGRLALAARLAERARVYGRSGSAAATAPPQVRVDNSVSESSTVLEVHAADSIGVLYRITHALSEMDLDIRSAKVQTLGNDVVDAFYVRDAAGNKVDEPGVLAEIELAIQHVLREERPPQPLAGRSASRDRRGTAPRAR